MGFYFQEGDDNCFESLHSLHALTGDGKHLITLSGVVRIDLKGTSGGHWRDELIILKPKVIYIPYGKALQVIHWVPYVTLNTVFNDETANYAGWGVNNFWCKFINKNKVPFNDPYPMIQCQVVVRDSDGWILRLGYHLTLLGDFIDHIIDDQFASPGLNREP